MSGARARTEDEILADMKRDWADTRRFYSNRGKEERERWVTRAFVNTLGIPATELEFRSQPQASKIDVCFDGANFQVKELTNNDNRRGQEIKEISERVMAAKTLAEVVGPGYVYDMPEPIDAYDFLLERLRKLSSLAQYADCKSELDLLLYVTRTRVSKISPEQFEQDSLAQLGWRSISCLVGGSAVVLYTASNAPQFLRVSTN